MQQSPDLRTAQGREAFIMKTVSQNGFQRITYGDKPIDPMLKDLSTEEALRSASQAMLENKITFGVVSCPLKKRVTESSSGSIDMYIYDHHGARNTQNKLFQTKKILEEELKTLQKNPDANAELITQKEKEVRATEDEYTYYASLLSLPTTVVGPGFYALQREDAKKFVTT